MRPVTQKPEVMNTISIKIKNALTNEVEVDSTIVVEKYDNEVISANHEAFSQIFPDSYVNFSWNNDTNFIFGQPWNEKKKEEYTEDDHLMDFCENYAE